GPEAALSPILHARMDQDLRRAYILDATGQVFYLDLTPGARAGAMQLRALAFTSVDRKAMFLRYPSDGSNLTGVSARLGVLTNNLISQRDIAGTAEAAFIGHG